MLPTVDFCGLTVTRLIIGANPFGGFSHQSKQRDQEMVAYHTPQRILQTWGRAQESGINTMITNNETEHVIGTTRQYLAAGGQLQWIAQMNFGKRNKTMLAAIDEAVEIGCKAMFIHGGVVDNLFAKRDEQTIRDWCLYARSKGVPVGVAGHSPEAHLWVDSLNITDFHAVCFFNCGSLHNGQGDRFSLRDIAPAIDTIHRIKKPCIGYKIMGAGRIDARMAFEHAFDSIKPGDVVNVGMHRGDNDNMVEENAALVSQILKPR
jgi:hypothetical protein